MKSYSMLSVQLIDRLDTVPGHGQLLLLLLFDFRFWQGLGHHMSKLYPGQSVIHLMESNVAGNRQGENVRAAKLKYCLIMMYCVIVLQLLSDLEAALYSHQVKVVSPLEMAPSGKKVGINKNKQSTLPRIYTPKIIIHAGREMLNMYFDPGKHKLWKMMRYTKLRMYK